MIKRNFLLFLFSCIAFIGAVVAALATAQQRDFELRGYVNATQAIDLPFRGPRLGVNADLTQYAPDDLHQQLNLMQRTGITWVRQFVYWSTVEPRQGEYNWQTWDTIFDTLDEYPSLETVVVLVDAPDWATTDSLSGDGIFTPPASPETYAAFVGGFATRYPENVDFYQIWDEPNIQTGWGNTEPRATGYAALLQAAYTAIHNADPSATVIAAALAPTTETGPQNISDILYLRDLYALGVGEFTDAIAAKPYGFGLAPDDRTVENETLNFSRIVALREVMVENGDAQTPLWASTWGWNSLPPEWAGEPSLWGQVTADAQVNYMIAALERAEREWPWLGGMVLYHWQPNVAADNPLWGFSLLTQEGMPTPLLQALMAYNTPAYATNGLYPARNEFAQYHGTWTFSNFGADIGWVEDSHFSFDFTGSEVALLVREGDYVAHLYPSLDNAEVNALPRDVNGNPFLLLRSDTLEPEMRLVPVAVRLPDSAHTLSVTADELVPDELVNRWPLVGYAVSSGDLAAPYNRQITIAWVTALIAVISIGVAGWRVNWRPVLAYTDALWRQLGNAIQIVVSVITSMALLVGMFITWGDGIPAIFRRDEVQIGLSILTSGLIYINEFGIVITLLAAVVLFTVIYNRPELGLMLVVFWVPFFLFPVELYQFAFPIAEVILLTTVGAWLLRVMVLWGYARQTTITRYPVLWSFKRVTVLDYAVLAWVVLGFISLLWAEHAGLAITELRTLIIQPALFYLVFRTIPIDRNKILLIIDALLMAGFVVSVVGLLMWLSGQSVITAEDGARRLASVYGSPNNVGLLIGRCIPFALAFLLLKMDRNRRIFAGIVLMGLVPALVLTQSAGALFIGIPVAVSGVLLLVWRKRAVLPLLGLMVIFVAGVVIALQLPRFSRLVDFSEGTNFYRIRVWESAINMIDDHPITGIGLDQFLYAFRGTYIMPDAWQEPELSHPHNIVLDFWTRLGIMGVALLILMQHFFWKTGLRLYQIFFKHHHPLLLAMTIGAMGSMMNLLMHGLVDNSVYVLDLTYIFMLLLAINATLRNISAIDGNLQ